jgi:hypothetical protein
MKIIKIADEAADSPFKATTDFYNQKYGIHNATPDTHLYVIDENKLGYHIINGRFGILGRSVLGGADVWQDEVSMGTIEDDSRIRWATQEDCDRLRVNTNLRHHLLKPHSQWTTVK